MYDIHNLLYIKQIFYQNEASKQYLMNQLEAKDHIQQFIDNFLKKREQGAKY